jgi:predicted Na+-dependent transporter
METMQKTNALLEKWIFVIMPAFMLTGFAAGGGLSRWTGWTPFLFAILTFISSLNADYRKFAELLRKPLFFAVFLAVAHVAVPWIVWLAGSAAFRGRPDLATGIALTALLPLGVTSIFWVAYNKGNVEMNLSLVSLDTLLSPLIVPAALSAVLGSRVSLNAGALAQSLFQLVLIPTVLGMFAGQYLRRTGRMQGFKPAASVFSKVCLYAIVLLNAASISGPIRQVGHLVLPLVLFVLCTMAFGYFVHGLVGLLFTRSLPDRISVSYSGGVRNYTVGVVLAASFFRPAAALPILLAMLFQHPMALLVHYMFRRLAGKPGAGSEAAYKSASL